MDIATRDLATRDIATRDIATRDLNIQAMKEQLVYRHKMLLDKRDDLRQIQKDNTYLVGIANDYERYYSTIKNERKRQMEAFELISKYVSNIASDTNTTEQLVTESRRQQREITKEIDRLRVELDKMTD